MEKFDLIVIGGGAAGFMTAITAAENGAKRIKILEATNRTLEKVRISGGGRCNLTNASWIPNELVDNYPRGGKKLLESLSRFATGDVYEWFENKGLKLKIENDNRVFPISDSSIDVVNCLKKEAEKAGIQIEHKNFIKKIKKESSSFFKVFVNEADFLIAEKVMISTGGNQSGYKLAQSLGHKIVKPVPSIFALHSKDSGLEECSGVSIKNVSLRLMVKDKIFENKGDLLITHKGFSGPSVLKLSSIAARELSIEKYKSLLNIKWSNLNQEELLEKIDLLRKNNGKSTLNNVRPVPDLTRRLWLFLLNKIDICAEKKWANIIASERDKIVEVLLGEEYIITGKGPTGEEFVTAGGVDTNEVNFKTMESLISSGLYFSGEILNVDGITGGFNFQHCWTSGWLAGKAISEDFK